MCPPVGSETHLWCDWIPVDACFYIARFEYMWRMGGRITGTRRLFGLAKAAFLLALTTVFIPAPTALDTLTIGAILPDHSFFRRTYKTALIRVLDTYKRDRDFTMTQNYSVNWQILFLDDYSPPEILTTMCDAILEKRVNTILYLSNADHLGEHTSAGQYLLQTANFMGIPVIAWNGDNSGFFQVSHNHHDHIKNLIIKDEKVMEMLKMLKTPWIQINDFFQTESIFIFNLIRLFSGIA